MLTYGSYLSRNISVTRAAFWVTALDTGVALLAGLAILPAVFAFGPDGKAEVVAPHQVWSPFDGDYVPNCPTNAITARPNEAAPPD